MAAASEWQPEEEALRQRRTQEEAAGGAKTTKIYNGMPWRLGLPGETCVS